MKKFDLIVFISLCIIVFLSLSGVLISLDIVPNFLGLEYGVMSWKM